MYEEAESAIEFKKFLVVFALWQLKIFDTGKHKYLASFLAGQSRWIMDYDRLVDPYIW